VRAGLAIGTEPPADSELERGKIVTLLISSGPKLVQVPSVIGQQQDLAESAIRGEGLIPVVEQRDSDEPEGQVIAQDPAAGSTVKKHTTVTVVVSTGAGSATVPNVVGESKDQARADLKDAGLSVRIVKRMTSDPNEDGQVLDQSPVAGTRLRRGEFVTVFVGKFKEPPTTTTPTTTTQSP
jgi:beta-lactam-binding protein with PASTA domain